MGRGRYTLAAWLAPALVLLLSCRSMAADQDMVGSWMGYAEGWKHDEALRDIGARWLVVDAIAGDGSVAARWDNPGGAFPAAEGRVAGGTLSLTSAYGATMTLRLAGVDHLVGTYVPPRDRRYVLLARAHQATRFAISLARARPSAAFDGAWQGTAAPVDPAACPAARYDIAIKEGRIAGTAVFAASQSVAVSGTAWADGNLFFRLAGAARDGLFHGRAEGARITALDPAAKPGACGYRLTLERR